MVPLLAQVPWDAIKDLGGWAVVVFVIWWLMRRMDQRHADYTAHIGSLIETLRSGVENFATFEREERDTHAAIIQTQNQLIDRINDVAKTQKEMLELLIRLHENTKEPK